MDEISPRPDVESRDTTSTFNALPAELFLDILIRSVNFNYQHLRQLHNLAQVSRYWFQSIISCPLFWRVIDYKERHLAPMIIRRNPNGPLAIKCWCGEEDGVNDFLELVRGQAHRWDALDLSDYCEDQHMQFVNAPTPALVTLRVSSRRNERNSFPLSVISTLRHVQVHGVRVPWDSPSLTGLKSLSIDRIDSEGPSLRQIVAILSASPALKWFALQGISDPPASADDTEVPERTIPLRALRGLYLLQSHTSRITYHLLKTIDAPQCSVLEATVPSRLIQNPGPTFSKLASNPMSVAKCIHVSYYGANIDVSIYPEGLLADSPRGGWKSEGSRRVRIYIENVPYSANILESITNTLGFRVAQSAIVLRMHSSNGGASNPAELFENRLSTWTFVTNLSFTTAYGMERILSDLRFIATPIIENGHARWPCPRLTCLELEMPMPPSMAEEVAQATLDFLEKRSVAGREVGITWDAPVPLKYLQADEEIFCVLRGTEAAKGIHFFTIDDM